MNVDPADNHKAEFSTLSSSSYSQKEENSQSLEEDVTRWGTYDMLCALLDLAVQSWQSETYYYM